MTTHSIRSPFFYVGDKYKLMPQLTRLFPPKISTYIEPFVGGGSSFLNTVADKYCLNDIDPNVIALHKQLISYASTPEQFLSKIYKMIEKYNLSCSYLKRTVPEDLKKKYIKTYFAHFNKDAYNRMKADYNKKQDTTLLYLLLIYGFNHMIRFNKTGQFNLPVGNVDFNKNVYTALTNYWKFILGKTIDFYNLDYSEFLKQVKFDKDSYVYFDPPYLISDSEYNKFWNEKEEIKLCKIIDELNEGGIKFGITNLVLHKGRKNSIFLDWAKKYNVFDITSNYISFNDNTIKENSKEVFVSNYGRK